MSVLGVHHVTAVTADVVRNLTFYTSELGLRLVKKSVNQDDVAAYHLFYADAVGSPGTDLTFFDWPRVGDNQSGLGTISLTTFVAPAGSLDAWEARFSERGLYAERDEDPRGRDRLVFSDGEGQRLALVDGQGVPVKSEPFTAVVGEEMAIRGILGVNLLSARPDATHRVLVELLGFTPVARTDDHAVFAVSSEGSMAEITLEGPISPTFGRVGAGGVHHVAFRARDDEHLRELQAKIEGVGLQTSGYVDRFWFHSLYFREPGGILFEIATDGPGFAVDEDPHSLGENTVLPPFLEDRRAEIEAGLKPLPRPAYLGAAS